MTKREQRWTEVPECVLTPPQPPFNPPNSVARKLKYDLTCRDRCQLKGSPKVFFSAFCRLGRYYQLSYIPYSPT